MVWDKFMEEFQEKLEKIRQGGGPKRIEKQHAAGKMTARERIDYLVDPGSFVEFGAFVKHRSTEFGLDKVEAPADGVVTGFATIGGRLVGIASQDFTVLGGSVGEMHGIKIAELLDKAMLYGVPVIMINDSGGARIQEGVDSLRGYGDIFYRNVKASGYIPQIAVIMGPCAGGAVYSPALMDFVVMSPSSYMFITGPNVIKAVTGEDVTKESLGGPQVHTTISGNAHLVGDSEEHTLDLVKELLSYLPQNAKETPPIYETSDPINRTIDDVFDIVPAEAKMPFDVRQLITRFVDDGHFFEIMPGFAPNIVIGFARLGGQVIGIIANQPSYFAGVLDINASDKAARFIRTLDAFNIPIVTLVDTPGYMPGTNQEYGGIIRHGAKLLYAYSEATVPKVTLILRKSFGGAYLAMASKHLASDVVMAYPAAQIAVMEATGAANIIFRKEIQKAPDPKKAREEKIKEYREKLLNPYVAAARYYIDDIIDPRATRPMLYNALQIAKSKDVHEKLPKKHGNMPL